MTRWLIRLAFPALGLLLVLILFGVRAPERSPEPPEETREEASTIPSFEALVPAPVTTAGPEVIFKWQDASGSWHYADQPPEQGPWNTLAIEPGEARQPVMPANPGPADDDLSAPYSAPFALEPGYPGNDS